MLYVIATPIGNLEDITYRAVGVLGETNILIAENPSHSQKLLQHYKISGKKILQFADHNEAKMLPKLIELLKTQNGAIMSDAGTPGVSDPGFRLVRACTEAGIPVTPLPGPSASVSALSASGLPTDRFLFVGFLPKTLPKLKNILEIGNSTESTIICYESPQRISKTISNIAEIYPDAKIVIAREVSKLHEEFIRGNAKEVSSQLNKKVSIKGEITLLISFK